MCGCWPAAECRDPACGSSLRVNNHGHGYTHKQTHNQTHVKLLLWPQVNLYNHYGRWMVKCIHWISITLSHEHFDSHIRKPAKILSTEYYSKWFNLRWVLLSPLYIYHCCKSAKLHFLSVLCCSLQMPHTTGCPTIEFSLCFACFLSFQSSYRRSFYHFTTAQET